MRITKVRPIHADRFLFVEVETDAGLTGLGESGAWGHLAASRAALETFGAYLVGKDPLPIEHHWNVMQRTGHFRGTAICGAVSAIDIALWDIKGQALGVPIHALLGGPTRTRARVYGHVIASSAEEMVETSLAMKEQGYTALGHLNPFLDEDPSVPYFKPHATKMADGLAVLQAVREAIGDTVDICVEIHRRLTPPEAITFGHEIAPLRPFFYEDPIPPESPDAMALVSERVPVPVATGERFASLFEFQTLVARRGVQYLRPCVCVCGGITGARKIAAIAEANNLQIVPHNPLSPVSLAACLQLAGGLSNVAIVEYPTHSSGGAAGDLRGLDMIDRHPRLANGFATVPTDPGLGTALVPGVASTHPPRGPAIGMRPHVDGFVVDQ